MLRRFRTRSDASCWKQGDMSFNMKAVFLLFTLLVVTAVLTALFIVVPLALSSRRVDRRGSLPLFLFFAAIESASCWSRSRRCSGLVVFLGHPVYGFSVVLFSLLLSSGLGTLLGAPRPAGHADSPRRSCGSRPVPPSRCSGCSRRA
jgi:membrane protease YdiL (CAAX protease family)